MMTQSCGWGRMSSMIAAAGVPASIGEGFRRVNIVRAAMNNSINHWRTDTAAVRYQPDVVLHQSLALRWCLVGWSLPLGDGVDHINDDKGTLLWVQLQ